MARRSWRSFDYWLLAGLLVLSAYGVTMIYSATINTLGIDKPVQRQIIYVAAGTVLLFVVAAVNYQSLLILQHPAVLLTPLLLALGSVGLVVSWRAAQLQQQEIEPALALFGADLPAMLVGIALVTVVFVADRQRIETLVLPLARGLAVAFIVIGAALAVFLVQRMDPDRLVSLYPYALAVGLAVVYLLDCLTLRVSDTLRNPIYVLLLGLLGLIFVIGQVSGGSQRWLGAGTIQPSELSKLMVVVVLAKFLADREDHLERFGTVLTSLGIVAVPMLLIYLQPDLGTALTLIAIWTAMVWMVGLRLRHFLILVGIGVAIVPVAWFGLHDYMRDRLTVFVNPGSDPDSYFNVFQALVSIGSGGLTGKGLTHGTQSQLHFLRVRHTDFIFAVTAEELGFLGAVAMMALIFLVLWRVLRVAERSHDTFGRLIASGVAAIVLFQTIVNVGMNVGLMPVTGIPLPFVSYGGSSFITLMMGMGLVESVAMRRRKLEFD
jgi:rod shape determining protein RodA